MRRPFLMLSVLLLASMVAGQNVKEDFYDGEFFFAEEDYEEALYAFNKVYKSGYQDNANINYRMGICLLQIPGRKSEAIPHLEQAVEFISERYREGAFKEVNAPPDALLYLGNAYRINMELEKAREKYGEYDLFLGPRQEMQKAYTDKQIESCGNAVVAINNPVEYTRGNLGQVNETHSNRYNVVISNDMNTMAFMGKNPFYNSVQVSMKEDDGTWGKPKNITPSIVSDGNMDVVALSSDGKTMLLAVSDEFDSNIYTSVFANNRWNPAKSLGKTINSRYYESHATFSPDGKTIYFTSNRTESLGGMDIFRSDMLEDGTWTEPVNLGPTINTKLSEESPFLSPDGKRLYFSSQGHNTIGGFDLFYSELQANGNWGTPVNVGYPLNTTDDDLAFSPLGIGEEGASMVFAKGDGSKYDVYKFEFIHRDAKPVLVPMDEIEEVVVEVVEKKTEVAPEPEVVEPPEKYLIRPIFFEFDSYALSKSSQSKLNDLSGLIAKFPALKLEITGHTDAVGTFEYNQRLSVNRAAAVSKYLISNGVTKDRLKITGMSESEHVARNRTANNRDAPDGRELNRRVQFKVSITKDVIIEMEKINVPDHLKIN
ncbi:MAG: PD40 domain-containing protein [Bacteroidales bacterium]|nr:PD40 domain-containing protein [Bacteroidales bacterium]